MDDLLITITHRNRRYPRDCACGLMWVDVVPRRTRGDNAVDSANEPSSTHLLLDTWMNERRRKLRIKTWTQVAERAGMSDENLRKIRRGEISISENAADGIEDALQWAPGSVMRAVAEGVKPTPAESAPVIVEEADRLVEVIRGVLQLQGKKLTPRMVEVFLDELGQQIMSEDHNKDQ
jgi:hypothetical protein